MLLSPAAVIAPGLMLSLPPLPGREWKNTERSLSGSAKPFPGLDDRIEEHLVPLGREEILGLENKPSTILESSRFNPFSEENKGQKYPEN